MRAIRLFPQLLAISLCLVVSACSDDEYAVAVSWLINGLPPDDTACEENGVESVRLTIVGHERDRTLEADCSSTIFLSDGFDYGGFITTESFKYDRVYNYKVDMLDANGNVVVGYDGQFEALLGDFTPVELLTLELFDPFGDLGAVMGSFTLGEGDLAENCALAGIDTVELWVASATDPDFVDAEILHAADCSAGEIGGLEPVLAFGDYNIKYVALQGSRVQRESESFAVLVDGPFDFTLDEWVLPSPR
jgi:hypothetical protein